MDAYKIGIEIALNNKVSEGLRLIGRDFKTAETAAGRLEQSLNRIKLLGMAGAGMGMAGFLGLDALKHTLGAAREYAHVLNKMVMLGLTHRQIAEATAAAWKTAHDVITSTPTGNLAALIDLRNTMGGKSHPGSMKEAIQFLPTILKLGTVLAASTDKTIRLHPEDMAFAIAKAIDIVGGTRSPAEFAKQAAMMSQVIVAFQDRVTPEQFKQVFQYSRQARYGLSDEFKYRILPSFMLEYASEHGGGGGSRGVGPMLAAGYRMVVQGLINKKSMPLLQHLGLLQSNSFLPTTTRGTVVSPMRGASLYAENPFAWVSKYLVPAIKKAYPNATESQVLAVINQIGRGNQLAAAFLGEMAVKHALILRDAHNIKTAMPYGKAYAQTIAHDPETQFAAAAAQWKKLETVIGLQVLPIVIPWIQDLTTDLSDLARWARRHPIRFHYLIEGFAGLSAVLAIGGTVTAATAALKGLGVAVDLLGGAEIGTTAAMVGTLAGALTSLAIPVAALAAIVESKGFKDWQHQQKTATAAQNAALSKKLPAWTHDPLIAPFYYQPTHGPLSWLDAPSQVGRYAIDSAAHGLASLFSGDSSPSGPILREAIPPAHPHLHGGVTVHTHVNLDGRELASAIGHYQGLDASLPPTGPAWHDGRGALSPVQLPVGR